MLRKPTTLFELLYVYLGPMDFFKKHIPLILTVLSLSSPGLSQSTNKDLQSSPRLVLEEVFRAAATEDFSNLSKLCPSNQSNDGDTRQICTIGSSSAKKKAEFVSYFKGARITGKADYSDRADGRETAQINFKFGNGRGKETMNFIKVEDKWYLLSF